MARERRRERMERERALRQAQQSAPSQQVSLQVESAGRQALSDLGGEEDAVEEIPARVDGTTTDPAQADRLRSFFDARDRLAEGYVDALDALLNNTTTEMTPEELVLRVMQLRSEYDAAQRRAGLPAAIPNLERLGQWFEANKRVVSVIIRKVMNAIFSFMGICFYIKNQNPLAGVVDYVDNIITTTRAIMGLLSGLLYHKYPERLPKYRVLSTRIEMSLIQGFLKRFPLTQYLSVQTRDFLYKTPLVHMGSIIFLSLHASRSFLAGVTSYAMPVQADLVTVNTAPQPWRRNVYFAANVTMFALGLVRSDVRTSESSGRSFLAFCAMFILQQLLYSEIRSAALGYGLKVLLVKALERLPLSIRRFINIVGTQGIARAPRALEHVPQIVNIHNNDSTCPICYNDLGRSAPFNPENPTGRISILPCGHHLCQGCEERLEYKRCPTCRVIYNKIQPALLLSADQALTVAPERPLRGP